MPARGRPIGGTGTAEAPQPPPVGAPGDGTIPVFDAPPGTAGVSLVPDNRAAFALRALSARAAAGTLDIRLAPVVNVDVDTSGGPSHGQTLCDLRGMYRGYPEQEGAHCRVLLETDDGIADEVVELIAGFGDALIAV